METKGKYMLVIYKTNIKKKIIVFLFEHKQLKQNEDDNIWLMEAGVSDEVFTAISYFCQF